MCSSVLIHNSKQDICAVRCREHYRRQSSKNVRAGTWGEGVQNALRGAQQPLPTASHSSPGCLHMTSLPTTNHGWRGDHGPYHYLMDYHLVVDSGGETVFYSRCGPTAKPTVFQALNTSKRMTRRWACLKSVNHKRIQTGISVGNGIVGWRGTDGRGQEKTEGVVRETRMHLWDCYKANWLNNNRYASPSKRSNHRETTNM